MSETAVQATKKMISARIIDALGNPVDKRFNLGCEGLVEAQALKDILVRGFNQSAVHADSGSGQDAAGHDARPVSDENAGYHLTALDENGKRTVLADDETFELGRYSGFELTPRTAGGGRGGRP